MPGSARKGTSPQVNVTESPSVPVEIDEQLVRHVAQLARIKLDAEEAARLANELSSILEYMDHLNEVDTTDVPPTAHALQLSDVFREDEVVASPGSEVILANAPDRVGSFFQVPKVLDQDSA